MPGAGLIRVTPEQLQSASGQLNNGAAQINGTLNQLMALVNSLGESWIGSGGTSFNTAMINWKTSQANLIQAVETIAGLTGRASVSYLEHDVSVGGTFGPLA